MMTIEDYMKFSKHRLAEMLVERDKIDSQRQDDKLDIYNLKVSRAVIPCDYLHQLQHALRLCGIDKTIEL